MTSIFSRAAERTWLRAASAIGRRISVRAGPVPPADRVLVVAPHPDDETIGAGGTILLHRAAGTTVEVVVVTDGGQSKAAGATVEERVSRRRREASEAARVLGVPPYTWLGRPEQTWPFEAVVEQLQAIFDDRRPSIIYAPSRIDGHPDHVRVARALAAVKTRPSTLIRAYQIQTPLTPLLVNRAVDTSSVRPVVERASAAYRSQAGSIERTRRLRRYSARFHRGRDDVEVFWELPADDYRRLHADAEPSPGVFAGLFPGPLRDPIAYLAGLDRRLALRFRTPQAHAGPR